MKKILFMVFMLMLTYQCVSSAAQQPPARYEWIESNEDRAIYFDTRTITFVKDADKNIEPSLIDVWLYVSCNDRAVQNLITYRMQHLLPIAGWDNLDYYKVHYQFNLKTKQYTYTAEIFYDKSGKVLGTNTISNAKWNDIPPDSVGAKWFEKIQDYSQKWFSVLKQRAAY